MYMYSNAFSYSANADTCEFMITFSQQHPVLGSDGLVKEITTEPVASIIVNKGGLEALRSLINEIQVDK